MTRGVIKHVNRAQQINSFEGIQYGRITPTDIDGLIEYQDKAYIFIEIKYGNKDVPRGQKLALYRMVKDAPANDKVAVAIICEHNVHDTNEHIQVADLKVRELCLSNQLEWRKPKIEMTVKEMVDSYIGLIRKGVV